MTKSENAPFFSSSDFEALSQAPELFLLYTVNEQDCMITQVRGQDKALGNMLVQAMIRHPELADLIARSCQALLETEPEKEEMVTVKHAQTRLRSVFKKAFTASAAEIVKKPVTVTIDQDELFSDQEFDLITSMLTGLYKEIQQNDPDTSQRIERLIAESEHHVLFKQLPQKMQRMLINMLVEKKKEDMQQRMKTLQSFLIKFRLFRSRF